MVIESPSSKINLSNKDKNSSNSNNSNNSARVVNIRPIEVSPSPAEV
jgi:hypothetical protein